MSIDVVLSIYIWLVHAELHSSWLFLYRTSNAEPFFGGPIICDNSMFCYRFIEIIWKITSSRNDFPGSGLLCENKIDIFIYLYIYSNIIKQ